MCATESKERTRESERKEQPSHMINTRFPLQYSTDCHLTRRESHFSSTEVLHLLTLSIHIILGVFITLRLVMLPSPQLEQGYCHEIGSGRH